MLTRKIIVIFSTALLAVSSAVYAESEQKKEEHPYVGVMLDRTPLPDLLIKHLGLSPNQGIRIVNVDRDTPADKAGLERDDIIIAFQGKDVKDRDEFVEAVRQAGIGAEVSVDIIHLGKHKTIKLNVANFSGELNLKYPPEPEIVQSWRPGKVYKLKPGDKSWIEIPFQDIPGKFELQLKMPSEDGTSEILKEVYMYHFSSSGQAYTITIEGSPYDEDSEIIVRIGESEQKTMIGEIDKLPEKYRQSAEKAVEEARESSQKRKTEEKVDADEKLNFPFNRSVTPAPFRPDDEMFDRIGKQMREFQKRLEKLEERQRDTLERFPEKLKKQKSQEPEQIEQEKV